MTILRQLAIAFAVALASACAWAGELQAFSTDGCSLFPDRALIGSADWCDCCVKHDLAYWRGGSAEERLAADRELQACVNKATDNASLAELMFAGVRTGGGPYFYTPYRWGYGWPYGRAYTPLSGDEKAKADALQGEYLTTHTPLSCPSRAAPAISPTASAPLPSRASAARPSR